MRPAPVHSEAILPIPPYTRGELKDAYRALGVERDRTVVVAGNLGRLLPFEDSDKTTAVDAHFKILSELLGPGGTLVVPTASLNLLGTDTPFDPDTTPSHQIGPLSERVRTWPGARRSFHPFVSYAALGAHAAFVIDAVARHAFGPETPEARLVEMDALHVGIGLPVRVTQATIHHVEHMMAVPYRYTREYLHPVKRDGQIAIEPFYMLVKYDTAGVERNYNKRLFQAFEADYPVRRVSVGRGTMASYSMAALCRSAVKSLTRDIYAWAEQPPSNPVYRQRY
jgi:aminoglycoside 3-N-acetyltransferase